MINCGQPTRGSPPAWKSGEVLKTPHRKKLRMLRNITRGLGFGLLAQDMDTWGDLVNAVMDQRGSIKMPGISRLSEDLLASREGLYRMELGRW
jgi:hypothetical protein